MAANVSFEMFLEHTPPATPSKQQEEATGAVWASPAVFAMMESPAVQLPQSKQNEFLSIGELDGDGLLVKNGFLHMGPETEAVDRFAQSLPSGHRFTCGTLGASRGFRSPPRPKNEAAIVERVEWEVCDDDEDPWQVSLSDDLKGDETPTELPSLGSTGHFEGTCKRCCFHPKGTCKNGRNCEFCHFEHEKKPRKARRAEAVENRNPQRQVQSPDIQSDLPLERKIVGGEVENRNPQLEIVVPPQLLKLEKSLDAVDQPSMARPEIQIPTPTMGSLGGIANALSSQLMVEHLANLQARQMALQHLLADPLAGLGRLPGRVPFGAHGCPLSPAPLVPGAGAVPRPAMGMSQRNAQLAAMVAEGCGGPSDLYMDLAPLPLGIRGPMRGF
mmetsp:Transcript_9677/g.21063  ORF Transcript_9677/g.21063 Transcript_9677/m.21063 type:complete len:387 (+) Transcript_9677:74-1234(+)